MRRPDGSARFSPPYGALLSDREHYRIPSLGTPLHALTSRLNEMQAWERWNGYLVARRYGDPELEHAALRNACTVADRSPLAKYRVRGPDALAFLNRLFTGRMASVAAGEVRYALMCDGEGRLLDDGLLFHLREGDYRFCCRSHHLDWLLLNTEGYDVSVADETHELAVISLQGPVSGELLRRMAVADITRLPPNALVHQKLGGVSVTVARTGFTGDLGYELFVPEPHAEDCWLRLFEHRELGLTPVGEQTQDLARLESGWVLSGREYLPADRALDPRSARTPLELGLERFVDFEGKLFNGRRALLEQRRAGVPRRLVPVFVQGAVPARDALVSNYRGRKVGVVTSAAWSPSIKQNVALALLDAPWGRTTDGLWADIRHGDELDRRRRRARLQLTAGAFFDPVRRRVTPVGRF